jgi:hypothetical protein
VPPVLTAVVALAAVLTVAALIAFVRLVVHLTIRIAVITALCSAAAALAWWVADTLRRHP